MRVYARMCARVYDCQDTQATREEHTPPDTGHRRNTPLAKRGTQAKHKNKICDCWEISTQTTKKS